MLVAVVGQTASGKSEVGIELACHLGGPAGSALLGMDAMQLYRGLDIGTAKTPAPERRGIPHYQIDELEIESEASVATYQRRAREDIQTLQAQGRSVVAVGGSGLYVRAALDDMAFPGRDPDIRAELERQAETHGPSPLYRRLQELDLQAASHIHPHNVRRVIRALEVIELTGQPFSSMLPKPTYFFPDTVQLAISWPTEILDDRIDTRTVGMFRDGLVEETRALLDAGRLFGKTAIRATGYAEALAVIRGEITPVQAIEQVALATRQLARKQMKWFKRDTRIFWIEGASRESMVDQALSILQKQGGSMSQRPH